MIWLLIDKMSKLKLDKQIWNAYVLSQGRPTPTGILTAAILESAATISKPH